MLGKHPAPVVNRSQRVGFCSVQNPSAIPPHRHQPDIAQHLQVFRHRGLLEGKSVGDFANRSLFGRNEFENVPTTRFGDRVERIRRRGSARHA
jgi:hypothetical protein